MSITKTTNFQSSDQSSNLQSSNQNQAIDKLSSSPLSNGALLPSVKLSAGSNQVSHKLGRKLQGYIVVMKDSASDISQSSADTSILTINASAACNVTLFVF